MKVLLFPGQGSQAIGMGLDLFEAYTTAKDVFKQVDDVLNQNLSHMMFKGDITQLSLTENAQPAIMAVSMAVLHVLKKDYKFDINKHISYVAGHSLGEYSALCSVNSISLTEVSNLLKVRGRAMQMSSNYGIHGMVAVLGITDLEQLNKLIVECKESNEVLVIANDNSIGQVVLSGHNKSLDNVIAKYKDFGAMKAVKLNVSGAFHTTLMQGAAEKIADELSNVEIKTPIKPIISNVLATEVSEPNDIKNLLIEQMTSKVRWTESMQYLVKQKVSDVIEVGHGSVLTGLMKRIDSNVNRINLQSPKDIDTFMEKLVY